MKKIIIIFGTLFLIVAAVGMYKFNYLSGQSGYDVDGNKITESNSLDTNTQANMQENNFIYADLSTYDVEKAKEFYGNVFGWEYFSEDEEYHVAFLGDKAVSGLYEMPERFKTIKMPSFWMTYIQVESVEETVEKARKLDGIIEAQEEMPGFGKVALIRDPSGAGFTVYEGNQLDSRNFETANTLVWNELFLTDVTEVQDFYTGIFDWEIEKNNRGNYSITNSKKEEIGAITEMGDDLLDGYRYWGSVFLVDDMQETKKKVLGNGGTLLFEQNDIMSFTDFSGVAFFYIVDGKQW